MILRVTLIANKFSEILVELEVNLNSENLISGRFVCETVSTVGKIYTQIFSFFRKRVVNMTFLELRPLSNERSGNFTFSWVFTII